VRIDLKASRLGHPFPLLDGDGDGDGDGGALWLPGRRKQTILALLLLHTGQTVSLERIIDAVWPDTSPPATAREQVQNCTTEVRRILQSARCEGHPPSDCGAAIVTGSGGYRLQADPATVDAVRFDTDVRECLSPAGRPDDEVVTVLRGALALWRGGAFGNLPSLELQAEAARLEELRLVATEELTCREIRLNRVPELHAAGLLGLIRRYPYRERLRLLHMEALHRSGRTTEALERFREYRSMLIAEHGVEPGPEIRAKEREILRRTG
jgi:DNA-binding SARP family transcriptional activator